jgi:hypothetical protein
VPDTPDAGEIAPLKFLYNFLVLQPPTISEVGVFFPPLTWQSVIAFLLNE